MRYDILLHISVLFVVTLLAFPMRRSWIGWLLLFTIPPLAEIGQFFLAGRTSALDDMYAGWGGIIMAWCIITLWNECYPTFSKYFRMKRRVAKEAKLYGAKQRGKGL
jgi:hypothetical protein